MRNSSLIIILCLLAISCGKQLQFFKKSSNEKQPISAIYDSGTLKVNVFYEEGAEPFTVINGSDLNTTLFTQIKAFTVLEENLKSLFPKKSIMVPKDISSMTKIDPLEKTQWTEEQMGQLGLTYGLSSRGKIIEFNIFFVKGKAKSNSAVIGVHLSNTQNMVIFKEVIESSSSLPHVKVYVEQSVLVHEMGHAIGLVNNGLPMAGQNHMDPDHPAHCSNPDCVMHWQSEGLSSLVKFIESRKDHLNLVLFDNACLRDVSNYQK